MTHADFEPLVRENGCKLVMDSKQFILFERGKAFKQVLKAFNFKEFSNITERAEESSKALEEIQLKLDQDTNSLALQAQVKELRLKAEFLVT